MSEIFECDVCGNVWHASETSQCICFVKETPMSDKPREWWIQVIDGDVYSSLKSVPNYYKGDQDTVHVIEYSAYKYAVDDAKSWEGHANEFARQVKGLEAALSQAIGHSNCYCEDCNKLTSAMFKPRSPVKSETDIHVAADKFARHYWNNPIMGHGSTHEGNIVQKAFMEGARFALSTQTESGDE